MFKHTALVVLMVASAVASAAPTWHFSYSGFYNQNAMVFDQDYQMSGYFSGQDTNLDGTLEKSELTAFVLNGVDYIACAATSNQYFHCGTDRFSYSLGGDLDFYAGTAGSDPEGVVMAGHYFEAGNRERSYRFTPTGSTDNSLLWTSDTQFQISQAPEPGTWMMLVAGLLVAGGAVSRRRHRAARLTARRH